MTSKVLSWCLLSKSVICPLAGIGCQRSTRIDATADKAFFFQKQLSNNYLDHEKTSVFIYEIYHVSYYDDDSWTFFQCLERNFKGLETLLCTVECRDLQIYFFRPCLCSKFLVSWIVLQEVVHCHWSHAAGALWGLSNIELGVHLIFELVLSGVSFS